MKLGNQTITGAKTFNAATILNSPSLGVGGSVLNILNNKKICREGILILEDNNFNGHPLHRIND